MTNEFDQDDEDRQARALDNGLEDRRFNAQQEAIRESITRANTAEQRVNAFDTVVSDFDSIQETENLTLDNRGENVKMGWDQPTPHDRAADGVFLGTVLIAHAGQQAWKSWQQSSDNRLNSELNDLEVDSTLEVENQVLEQALQEDIGQLVTLEGQQIDQEALQSQLEMENQVLQQALQEDLDQQANLEAQEFTPEQFDAQLSMTNEVIEQSYHEDVSQHLTWEAPEMNEIVDQSYTSDWSSADFETNQVQSMSQDTAYDET